MYDRLTPQNIRSVGAPNSMLPDPRADTIVDHHYFERIVSITNDTIINAVTPGQYGPFPLWSPPENVVRSVIQRVAVYGIPSAYFRSRFYWTFEISDGSVQEFVADTLTGQHNEVNTTQVIPGVRFTPFGYLDGPEPSQMLVKQGARLQIVIYGGDPVANHDHPNCCVRLQGINEFARPD